MAMENNNHDQINSVSSTNIGDGDSSEKSHLNPVANDNNDIKQINEATAPKENPFSFTQFLKRDTSVGNNNNNNCNSSTTINGIINSQSISNINGNDILTLNGTNTASPSKSATTSSLNTGTRPKIPQFQSVNLINVDSTKMKRSPKFSSFDSQSSLSDLAADEKSSNSNIMQSSRSNNSFNMEYQPPSSATTRSFSNYDIESPMMNGKQHSSSRNFNQRSQNNVNNSNNSTMLLPDFVQDHLLMEYYMNPTESPSANLSPLSGDDFSLGNNDHNHNHNQHHHNGNNEFKINYVPSRNDIPFDLTFNRSPNSNRRRGGNNQAIPLDLPLNNDRSHRSGSSDLPPDITNSKNGEIVTVSREETYGSHNEPELQRDQAAIDKMQTLPDFLSDGPIHSGHRLADVATVSLDDNNQSIMIRLQQENDRLRQDLDENRREMMEQARRIEDLEMQISHAKNLETQYNVTLAESMEQVEENLFVSNKRASEAQAQANKFKQQVKQLTMEIQSLRRENETLREGGAVGGIGASNSTRSRHLSRDLRLAASTAENNLRQLLSGVENLRMIAATIENQEQNPLTDPPNYLSDSDDNEFNAEGPAL